MPRIAFLPSLPHLLSSGSHSSAYVVFVHTSNYSILDNDPPVYHYHIHIITSRTHDEISYGISQGRHIESMQVNDCDVCFRAHLNSANVIPSQRFCSTYCCGVKNISASSNCDFLLFDLRDC